MYSRDIGYLRAEAYRAGIRLGPCRDSVNRDYDVKLDVGGVFRIGRGSLPLLYRNEGYNR